MQSNGFQKGKFSIFLFVNDSHKCIRSQKASMATDYMQFFYYSMFFHNYVWFFRMRNLMTNKKYYFHWKKRFKRKDFEKYIECSLSQRVDWRKKLSIKLKYTLTFFLMQVKWEEMCQKPVWFSGFPHNAFPIKKPWFIVKVILKQHFEISIKAYTLIYFK